MSLALNTCSCLMLTVFICNLYCNYMKIKVTKNVCNLVSRKKEVKYSIVRESYPGISKKYSSFLLYRRHVASLFINFPSRNHVTIGFGTPAWHIIMEFNCCLSRDIWIMRNGRKKNNREQAITSSLHGFELMLEQLFLNVRQNCSLVILQMDARGFDVKKIQWKTQPAY